MEPLWKWNRFSQMYPDPSLDIVSSSEVPKYIHKKRYVPVPEPSPPTYHKIPVPVPVKEPGKAGCQVEGDAASMELQIMVYGGIGCWFRPHVS